MLSITRSRWLRHTGCNTLLKRSMTMPLTCSSAGCAIVPMSVEQSNQKKLLPPMCAEQSEQEVVHLEVKTFVPPKKLAGRTGAERYECGGGDFTFGEQYTRRVAGVLRVKKVSIKAATALSTWSHATQLDIPTRTEDKPHVHVVIYLEVRVRIDLHAQFCDLMLIAYRLIVLACVT